MPGKGIYVSRKIIETDENDETILAYTTAADEYNKAREDMWVAYDAYLVTFSVWSALMAS
jgi:hypothetical protein